MFFRKGRGMVYVNSSESSNKSIIDKNADTIIQTVTFGLG
jgi:hypothetical protein